MTRRAWTDLALALAQLRAQMIEHAERSSRQRAAHRERIVGIDLAARAICRALRLRSRRFDSRRFMRIVTSDATD